MKCNGIHGNPSCNSENGVFGDPNAQFDTKKKVVLVVQCKLIGPGPINLIYNFVIQSTSSVQGMTAFNIPTSLE